MPRTLTYQNLLLGFLPGTISLAMLADLLACLPRPVPGQAAFLGRALLQDALGMLDALAPRDRLEAELAVQMVALNVQVRPTLKQAQQEEDTDRQQRLRRHAMALQRGMEGLGRQIARHRRGLLQMDQVRAPPLGWAYDLDVLEAVWREPERELPETALRPRPIEIPPGFGGPVAAEPAAQVAQPEKVAAAPKAPARVPLWQQAGRRYLDELTDPELKELVLAQHRGEDFPEPPERPAGEPVPETEVIRLSEAEFRAMSREQRWDRYGAWTETPE